MEQKPKKFEAKHKYLTKLKKPPYGFSTHLFFDSAIMLIFGGLFLHRISRLLVVNINWISVARNFLQDKNAEP